VPRLQRSLQDFLRRIGGQNVNDAADFEIPPFLFLTAALADDRFNAERVVFALGATIVSAGANAPKLALEPQTSDVEIVAAWASRPAAGLDLAWEFGDGGLLLAGVNTVRSTTGAAPTAFAAGLTALPTLQTSMNAPQNTTFLLPLAGVVVPAGRGLLIESAAAASTMHAGIVWRELQGAIS